jgi:hypothetical protein
LSAEMEASFVVTKVSLNKATWLGYPDLSAQLAQHVDAAASHIDAAFRHHPRGHASWQPLGFFSRKLEAAQTKWSAYDRELLAFVESISPFRFIWRAAPSLSSQTINLW